MKRALLAMTLLGLPVPVAAQTSWLRGMEGWLGAALGTERRSAAVGGSVGTGSGAGPMLEAGIRHRLGSLRLQYASTDFVADSGTEATGKVSRNAAILSLGRPLLSIDVGFGQRGFEGTLARRAWNHFLAGARTELPIGSTPLSAIASVHVYLGGTESGTGGSSASGRVGETSLRFAPARVPLFAFVTYRAEVFTVTGTSDLPSESAAVLLGAGVRFRR